MRSSRPLRPRRIADARASPQVSALESACRCVRKRLPSDALSSAPAPAAPPLLRKVLYGALFGVVVYIAIVLFVGWRELVGALATFPLWALPVALALSFGNYLIRFLKWERYRKLLGIRLDRRTSFTIYMAGFSMGITPGKMGEVLKSWLIRRVTGTPIHTSAPIVIAERVTDLLGYLILIAIGGIASFPEYRGVFWAGLGLCVVGSALLGSQRFARLVVQMLKRTPYAWRYAEKADGSFQSARVLFRPRELFLPTLESVASWGCECAAFWVIASQFCAAPLPFLYAVCAYALSAVAGAVAIVFPGGLGLTEGLLGTLLRRKYEELDGLVLEIARAKAGGATVLTRLCTLWFAVLLGLVFLARFERRYGRVEATPAEEPSGRDPERDALVEPMYGALRDDEPRR
ncbi:MAG: flippase-like domain-containing protein [Planctomycetota bacterium]|nr:MAG: flippase-like domain-containing protein [Planctomycetota bacterium]